MLIGNGDEELVIFRKCKVESFLFLLKFIGKGWVIEYFLIKFGSLVEVKILKFFELFIFGIKKYKCEKVVCDVRYEILF